MANAYTSSPVLPRTPSYSYPVVANKQIPQPNFNDVIASLKNPVFYGNDLFKQGQDILSPDTDLNNPGTKQILDLLGQKGNDLYSRLTSTASALAARRGGAGSSTEQFGVQEAGRQAGQATIDSQINVLNQALARQQAARDSISKALFERAGAQQTIGGEYGKQQAQLTSDELASLRNMDFSNRYLALQGLLGQQGIDIARENIGAERDIASQQGKNALLGSIISGGLPLLFGRGGFGGGMGGGSGFLGGFGGGGTLSNLFGGASTPLGQSFMPGVSGAGPGGIPLAGAGQNPFMAGGIGGLAAGTGLGFLGGNLGRQAFGGGNDTGGYIGGAAGYALGGPVGAALGSFLGTGAQRLGERVDKEITNRFGNTVGSITKPFTNPVGAVKSVSKSISKAFPF